MASYPNWNEWRNDRETRLPYVFEGQAQRPDYTFDSWLKMTQSFGDDVSSFVGQAKEKDQELDAELKKSKQSKPEKKDDEDDDNKGEEKEGAWKRLKDIAKERREADGKKSPIKSSGK